MATMRTILRNHLQSRGLQHGGVVCPFTEILKRVAVHSDPSG